MNKETYKAVPQIGFIFGAIAGFADWADDLNDAELNKYMCDARSKCAIVKWFDEVLYPVFLIQSQKNPEELINFILKVKSGQHEYLLQKMHQSLASSAIYHLETHYELFFSELAELLQKRLRVDFGIDV